MGSGVREFRRGVSDLDGGEVKGREEEARAKLPEAEEARDNEEATFAEPRI